MIFIAIAQCLDFWCSRGEEGSDLFGPVYLGFNHDDHFLRRFLFSTIRGTRTFLQLMHNPRTSLPLLYGDRLS